MGKPPGAFGLTDIIKVTGQIVLTVTVWHRKRMIVGWPVRLLPANKFRSLLKAGLTAGQKGQLVDTNGSKGLSHGGPGAFPYPQVFHLGRLHQRHFYLWIFTGNNTGGQPACGAAAHNDYRAGGHVRDPVADLQYSCT